MDAAMDVKQALGRIGVWTFQLDMLPTAQACEVAQQIHHMGYGTLWVPEAVGREAFTGAAVLLAGTTDLVVATGVATIWGRDPMTAASAQKTISEAYPGRFVLGLGVSHQILVEGVRLGAKYDKPYSRMVEYLDRMASSPFIAASPTVAPTTVLAALGPRMLRLAAEKTAGAHPYYVSPEHTAFARETMGPDAVLAPEQAVVLETDAAAARAVGRAMLGPYLMLPNYVNNWFRLGFTEDDLADGGSDRLVDGLIAWGTADQIADRVRAHHDAGADHVCIQVFPALGVPPPLDTWRELAAALA